VYVEQSLKVRLDRGEAEVWRMEDESDKEAVCHRFYSSYTANTLTRKLLKGLETSKDEGTYVIRFVKYAGATG
jgi:hypothetical protein